MFNYFSENKLQSSHNQFNHHQHHHLTNISIFTLIILLLSFHTVNSANYFDFDDDFSRKDLPKCQNQKSICGYMQLNHVGMNKIPICKCENIDCHLWWNIFDNRIVKHGNDFYKFCGQISENDLLPCHENEIAYISFGKTDLITGEKISDIQEMRCLCNDDFILKTNKTMFEMTDTQYIYGTEQICQKAPRCNRKQFCLSITETAETTIERRHCRCPPGKYCPKDIRLAYEVIKENSGTLYNMKCV
ncbi:hypothetical protein DERP_011540 [Dermatophagoides pteronyssinus]|uniref:Uncharacterized protein n=2 Tax=Dermatophagoides pteronyssinus TaxID=6956 RepID=A0ABQ8JCR1_DERPT|nr:hypothetical protein DERP_011540 [Dermatophagoides pteronyssinus]